MRTCEITGCNRKHKGRGYCGSHLWHFYTKGDPLACAENPRNGVTTETFWNRVDKQGDCWLWTAGRDKNGYGKVKFQNKDYQAHRLSFFIANGHWPTPQCLHSCDNPPCVNPAHLRAGTAKENAEDYRQRVGYK